MITKSLTLSLIFISACGYLHGTDVSSTGEQGGSTGWNLPAVWSNGEAPSNANDYFILNGHLVRSPQIAAHRQVQDGTFAGNSLTIQGGGTLLPKGSFVVNDLILNGGKVRHGEASSNTVATRHIIVWTGETYVATPSIIEGSTNNRRFEMTGPISGSADLNLDFLNSSISAAHFEAAEQSAHTGGVYLQGSSPLYSGVFNVTNGMLKAQGFMSLGSGSVVLNGNSGLQVEYPWYNPGATLTINGNSMVRLDNDIWIGGLTIDGTPLAEGETYNYAWFAANGYGAHFAEESTGSVTVLSDAHLYDGFVFSTRLDPLGSNWTNPNNWSDDSELSADKDYFVLDGHRVRTPQSHLAADLEDNLFAGNSLTLLPGGELLGKGDFTVHSLVLAGGSITHGEANNKINEEKHIIEWAGDALVYENSIVRASDDPGKRRFDVTATLAGDGQLDLRFNNLELTTQHFFYDDDAPFDIGGVYLLGANPDYHGTFRITRGFLKALAPGSLGNASVIVRDRAGLQLGYRWANVDATLTMQAGAMFLMDQDIIIGGLTIGGDAFAEGTYDYDYFINNGYGAYFTGNGTSTGSITIASELPAGDAPFRAWIERVEGEPESAILTWTSSVGKTYEVYFSATLEDGFNTLVDTVPSEGETTSLTVPLTGDRGFYIVKEL